jgi:hypothetical protein
MALPNGTGVVQHLAEFGQGSGPKTGKIHRNSPGSEGSIKPA